MMRGCWNLHKRKIPNGQQNVNKWKLMVLVIIMEKGLNIMRNCKI
uniref:Uncharacterized protein MANES_15G022100 n=1 Tax=Rhizophora mucronata TaxID=61149 RepID=A0A2P2KKZ0_RHIMU